MRVTTPSVTSLWPSIGAAGLAALLAACAATSGPGDDGPAGCVTQVRGTVLAPNGVDPMPDALIYLPAAPPPPLPDEVRCEPCGQPGTEQLDLLARARSGSDGSFTLRLPPQGAATEIYVQKGRWRRRVPIAPIACRTVALDPRDTRLPRSQTEGELPRMAVALGDYDAIECVLRHLGLAPEELTAPSGPGAVHLYDNTAVRGGAPDPGATLIKLLRDPAALRRYALLLVNCTEAERLTQIVSDSAAFANLLDFVAAGGRLYLSDWAYNLLAQQPRLAPFVCFDDDAPCTAAPRLQAAARGRPGTFPGLVPGNLSLEQAPIAGLATFLSQPQINLDTGALAITMPLTGWALVRDAGYDGRYPALTWLRGRTNGAERPLTVSFDYPSPALSRTGACGRVLYTSPHTRERPQSPGPGERTFPGYCPSGVTPQERVLEYLLFEVSACIPRPG